MIFGVSGQPRHPQWLQPHLHLGRDEEGETKMDRAGEEIRGKGREEERGT